MRDLDDRNVIPGDKEAERLVRDDDPNRDPLTTHFEWNEVACFVAFAAGLQPESQFDLTSRRIGRHQKSAAEEISRPTGERLEDDADLLFDRGNAKVDLPGRETMTEQPGGAITGQRVKP